MRLLYKNLKNVQLYALIWKMVKIYICICITLWSLVITNPGYNKQNRQVPNYFYNRVWLYIRYQRIQVRIQMHFDFFLTTSIFTLFQFASFWFATLKITYYNYWTIGGSALQGNFEFPEVFVSTFQLKIHFSC